MKLFNITLLIILSCFILTAHAEMDTTLLVDNAKDKLMNLEKALAEAKKGTEVRIEFPTVIPKTKKSYFVSYDTSSQQYGFSYMINVDSTPDCQGVKYCNIGIVSAKKNAPVDKMKDRHNKVITQELMLADGLPAYYTPGHAMGDYFPASIQWIDDNVLYMISWNISADQAKNARALMRTMANSAKHPGTG